MNGFYIIVAGQDAFLNIVLLLFNCRCREKGGSLSTPFEILFIYYFFAVAGTIKNNIKFDYFLKKSRTKNRLDRIDLGKVRGKIIFLSS